jgi:DNA-binding beta-propeller fold protein YncE
MFGRPGGAPGRFNIASGIARDSKGNFLVVDKLKGAVQVFDRSFRFVTQLAGWGQKPGQLMFPEDVAVDDNQRVYVTQTNRRGISVFALTYQ